MKTKDTAAQKHGAAHTPGPWKVWHSIRDGSVNVVNVARVFVCEVGVPDGNPKDYEIRADACLIAAAPDLLAALELARPWLVYRANEADLAVVDAAIAKAKGEA